MASSNKNKKTTKPNKSASRFWRIVESRWFGRQYAFLALITLLGTTVIWSLLSAQLQQNNSDQLVNSYLVENSQTFQGATLPGAHSFLIKWPIFWLNHIFGSSGYSFAALTVAITLITVGVLAGALYWVERRWLVFGTLCLALASSLLLVPAMPNSTGLLPVNMAMLATRNLEYALYLGCLILLARSTGLKTRAYWLAVTFLSLLVASDKLFLTLSAGGALLALMAYALAGRWNIVRLSANWLLASLMAGFFGSIWLWIINGSKLTHIAGQATTSPYDLVHGFHNIMLAAAYWALGILTNFGANPVFDNSVIRQIPQRILDRLLGLGGLGFVCNFLLVIVAAIVIWRVVKSSLKKPITSRQFDEPLKLSLMLVWSSLAASAAFVATNHDYSVDARYLTISLFAVFVVLAAYTKRRMKEKHLRYLPAIGLLFGAAAVGSLFFVGRTYSADKAAFNDINQRDQLIAEAVGRHPVNSLVGDYWRVMPIKLSAKGKLKVSPLDSCFTQRGVLSSTAWQANLSSHSFAYLLSLDGSLTDFKGCSLNEVINQYGRPNTSVLIAGSYNKPKELLLFYDRGAHKSVTKPATKTPSTVLPISLDELPHTSCSVPTVMNIVAHEDDDLLFMNPDLLHDITAGHCIRSVYITAGDAGSSGQLYWLSRQQGSEAAYSVMAGLHDIWIERIVQLNDHEFITVANPRGNSNISLLFMHLPDGGLKGQGFGSTGFQTLGHLADGSLSSIKAVDGQSSYNSDQLTSALTSLMHLYQPSEIHTQSAFAGSKSHDHNDHNTVGGYAKKAYAQYEQQQFEGRVTVPIKFYMGYTVHDLPANVADGDLQAKMSAFLAYGQYDVGVCRNINQCRNDQAYGFYLTRQYQNSF